MPRARVPVLILSIAALGGCAAATESEAESTCADEPRASVDWGARATPPSDGWIELRGARLASDHSPEVANDCTAAISCNMRIVAESYRFDRASHTLDLMLKNYGDDTSPLTPSAHVSYVLEDGGGTAIEHGAFPLTNVAAIAPGSTLHAGGQVGTSTHVERVWARVRL